VRLIISYPRFRIPDATLRYFDTLLPNANLTSTLNFIEGILRLSTKYFLTGLRTKCISLLKRSTFTPLTLAQFDADRVRIISRNAEVNNRLVEVTIRVILLAQEMGIPDVLPISYYIVATRATPERVLADGAVDWSWKEKTICMVGKEKLRAAWMDCYTFLHTFKPSPRCGQRQDCLDAEGRRLRLQWLQVQNSRHDDPLLPFDDWESLGVCDKCRDSAMARYTTARKDLWERLPSFFNLPTLPAQTPNA
jgi:hypothetical protein